MKTPVYNLIIIDESGSMLHVSKATIDGCNETINAIKASQAQCSETQEHFVSIFLFQGNQQRPSHYIFKNIPAADVPQLTPDDYQPWGSTPLYDAIGSTLADLKACTAEQPLAFANVTIITDGMENASRHYTHEKVVKMISALKEMGWNFNFIGANIDARSVARTLEIDNALQFSHDEEGMRKMWKAERMARTKHCLDFEEILKGESEMPAEERRKIFKELNTGYFDNLQDEDAND